MTDRIGIAASAVAAVGGAAGGACVATPLASLAGATSIPILTKLGALLGFTVVSVTPVGWVIGCALGGAVGAIAICRTVRGAGATDEFLAGRRRSRRQAAERFDQLLTSRRHTPEQFRMLSQRLRTALAAQEICPAEAQQLVEAIRDGLISIEQAFELLASMRGRQIENQKSEIRN